MDIQEVVRWSVADFIRNRSALIEHITQLGKVAEGSWRVQFITGFKAWLETTHDHAFKARHGKYFLKELLEYVAGSEPCIYTDSVMEEARALRRHFFSTPLQWFSWTPRRLDQWLYEHTACCKQG